MEMKNVVSNNLNMSFVNTTMFPTEFIPATPYAAMIKYIEPLLSNYTMGSVFSFKEMGKISTSLSPISQKLFLWTKPELEILLFELSGASMELTAEYRRLFIDRDKKAGIIESDTIKSHLKYLTLTLYRINLALEYSYNIKFEVSVN